MRPASPKHAATKENRSEQSTPPKELRAIVESVDPLSSDYCITLINNSDVTLVNGSLDYGDLLHPRNFGADDTHMPPNIWVMSPLIFDKLLPGEQIAFPIVGAGRPSKFDGPQSHSLPLKYFVEINHMEYAKSLKVLAVMTPWSPPVLKPGKITVARWLERRPDFRHQNPWTKRWEIPPIGWIALMLAIAFVFLAG